MPFGYCALRVLDGAILLGRSLLGERWLGDQGEMTDVVLAIACVLAIVNAYFWIKAAQYYQGPMVHKLFDIMLFYPNRFRKEGRVFHRVQLGLTLITLGFVIAVIWLWAD
jgi:hypothetical protein